MNVEQILFVLTIVIIFIALILIPFFIYKNLYKKGYKKDDKEDIIFPESSPESSLISDWKWNDKCRGNVKFMEKSQWPTFLDKNAWDDGCQGCKSVPNTSSNYNDQQQNNSRDSFQVIGDWMRIGQRNSGSFSNLSTAKSKNHWFNPPRNNTDDKPLEIEWYMYLDASSWGKTQKDIAKSGITKANWSAFWTFGHGMQLDPKNKDTNYGWPYCGEWDLAESLPVFSNTNNITDTTKKPNGFATGFHNGASGAYPPCCLKRDGIMYEKPNSQNSNSIFAIPAVTGKYGEALKNIKNTKDKDKYLVDNNSDLYYYAGQGDSNGSTFLTWGKALFKKKYGVFPKPKGTPPSYEEFEEAASLAYNTTIHCYLRCTTDSVIMYIKTNVDPSNPPKTNITSSMSQDEVKDIMEDNGYVTVFSSYGDFGSNADSTFSDQFNIYMGQAGMKDVDKIKPTNWHQNMMFVWSVITQMNNSGRFTNTTKDNDQLYFWKHLMSYMSDISIRGGGNYTKAMAPPGITDPNLVKLITQGYDATSYEQYNIKKLANFDNTKDVAVLDCRNILTRI
tara:strand:- start:116 stop:1795 length:1680 start_codon:yes stop_codon:yes gene_type:complete